MERSIRTAEILAVGTELTTGVTRDTNSGELARELTEQGVRVLRTSALPDDLQAVTDAFSNALIEADLVVSTGGLGPTPDDLTREAIAASCGLEPRVDPDLEKWLRGLFERRGIEMPEANRKQAWLIDGAVALPNARGSAPGWFLARPSGFIVALPGPPREMQPMWRDHALPRLLEKGLGMARVARTLRLSGIGESQIADLIGEEILRAASPQVATYARADAVDVVVSVEADDRSTAEQAVGEMISSLRAKLGHWVFAEGHQSWPDAIAARLAGRTLAVVEIGTGGQLQAMLGNADYLTFGELLRRPEDATRAAIDLAHFARSVREVGRADLGLALFAREGRGDTHVSVAITDGAAVHADKRIAFLGGNEGQRRAALAACSILWKWLASS